MYKCIYKTTEYFLKNHSSLLLLLIKIAQPFALLFIIFYLCITFIIKHLQYVYRIILYIAL